MDLTDLYGNPVDFTKLRDNTEFMRFKNFVDLPATNGLYNTVRMTGGMGTYGVLIGIWTLGLKRPKTAKVALQRVATTSASCAALGAVFAASTSVAAGIRGKDTPLNYAIGGASAGFVTGILFRSFAVGNGMAAVFAGSAALAKHWIMEGYPVGYEKPQF
ncbi:NADH dehydrogenase [ubiquinone] 1 alpha subcomplex subunit 11-like [Anneissia japonica]|uniref:NADH dehydrogenase [ubiquinone] 1 alpha subcomplex subunit 11-like n=1 Tax=Anneissia japonica TaxID=1529436 RepID=UPI0014256BE1|nr:NADH dehydrogenase [ubiquinone] 1 alpha subcomplex subunit 11-like [Anneissia japonica]